MIKRIIHKLIYMRREYILNRKLANYGVLHAKTITTWTSPEELKTLYNQALLLENGSNALEIGSYLGASTCYIVAGLAEKNGHITCVDTWNNETMPEGERDTFEEFQRNTRSIEKYITTVRKNTSELSCEDFLSKFEYVFIDGDHSYNSVKSDFFLVNTLTATGSLVFFHDSLTYEGVTRVIGEALACGNWNIGGSVGNLFWIIKK